MKLACKTDIGNQRSENQDNYRAGRLQDDTVWAIVCDGMGGARGGKLAAALAAEYVENVFTHELSTLSSTDEVRPFLLHTIDGANASVYSTAKSDPMLTGMGTTIVSVIIKDGYAHFAHVGDSRIYFYHDNILQLMTKDHSMVQELVEHGAITESEASVHPQKNFITRALGVSETVTADYARKKVFDKEFILLCSDGLTNCVSTEEIANIIKSVPFFECADVLINTALKNGGQDNITAVIIQVEYSEEQNG